MNLMWILIGAVVTGGAAPLALSGSRVPFDSRQACEAALLKKLEDGYSIQQLGDPFGMEASLIRNGWHKTFRCLAIQMPNW